MVIVLKNHGKVDFFSKHNFLVIQKITGYYAFIFLKIQKLCFEKKSSLP